MRGKCFDNLCYLSYSIHHDALVAYLNFFPFDEDFDYFSCSMVIKGVVCKKNIAHRRMTSKIEKPRLLILGGALEYQRVSNLLSSFDTLLQQVVIICLSICSACYLYLGM